MDGYFYRFPAFRQPSIPGNSVPCLIHCGHDIIPLSRSADREPEPAPIREYDRCPSRAGPIYSPGVQDGRSRLVLECVSSPFFIWIEARPLTAAADLGNSPRSTSYIEPPLANPCTSEWELGAGPHPHYRG